MALESKIRIRFNNAEVKDVCIDDEFGNVTATVNGHVNTDCGFIEDYR